MSFLSDYREFSKGSEAHPTYHTFSALMALSSIVSRRVWIEQGYFKIFPNLYIVLVGPPGNRKTSAMSIARSLLRVLENVPFSSDAVTKEKLTLDLYEQTRSIENLPDQYAEQRIYAPMTVMATELSEFLGANSMGMINFLTTIYDQEVYETRTKNKGNVKIVGPFLNFLACTTPDWITTYLRSDVISGGFSRRAIFVLETGKAGRIPFPVVTPEAQEAWARLVEYSRALQKIAGPMEWEPEAKSFYEQWYRKLEMPNDETVVGYYETKHMQLLKIASLLSLSESTDLVLRQRHLDFGLELLKLAETNLSRVFAGIGRNELNIAANKVLEILDRTPPLRLSNDPSAPVFKGMEERRLRGTCYSLVNAGEMDQVLVHLLSVHKVRRYAVTTVLADGKSKVTNYIVLNNE